MQELDVVKYLYLQLFAVMIFPIFFTIFAMIFFPVLKCILIIFLFACKPFNVNSVTFYFENMHVLSAESL